VAYEVAHMCTSATVIFTKRPDVNALAAQTLRDNIDLYWCTEHSNTQSSCWMWRSVPIAALAFALAFAAEGLLI
jgi:hypothetical protein